VPTELWTLFVSNAFNEGREGGSPTHNKAFTT
jgi:hypothetical protein